MNEQKQKLDLTALLVFFPSVVALAIIPILMRATLVGSKIVEDLVLFEGVIDQETGEYYLADVFSQCKALAVVVFACIMLVIALVCCKYMFQRAEKRSFIYVGASVAFVLMSLASTLGAEHREVALFGIFDRAEGLFTTACYFVLFLFTIYAFRKTQNFRYVIIALMICTGVNLIIGLFQYSGNNLFSFDWFASFAVDGKYADMLQLDEASASYGSMYGALYHYNYVGSFTGMVIPLFTVLAIYGKKLIHKIAFALFAAASLFMLFASSARSGIIAIVAAFIVGVFVFARVLIRRWKITVAVIAGAAVVFVGANAALDNALFRRIPSLVTDIVDFIAPADDTDLYSTLPVREIDHNSDGSISLTTQTDVLNIRFDAEQKDYIFSDNSGEQVELIYDDIGCITINDDDFAGLNFEIVSGDGNPEFGNTIFVWFNDDDENVMLFYLFNQKQIHMIDLAIGERTDPINAEAIGFEGKEKLGSSRGYIWSRTLPLLKNCLVTGYGPDHFVYAFPQNDYLAKYYSYNEGFYITVDKPHNLYLQIAVSNGLIALIAFLVICVFYLIDSLRLYALKKQYRIEQFYGISVMLAIVGYLAAGLFNDSVVSVAPVFWILLGTGVALNTINRRMDKGECADPDEYVAPARAKSKKELSRDAEIEQQAGDLASKIRGEEAEQREATHKKMQEVMEQLKAAAAAEDAARKERSDKRRERRIAEENTPPKPKKTTITKEEADEMLARVRALREKAENQKNDTNTNGNA